MVALTEELFLRFISTVLSDKAVRTMMTLFGEKSIKIIPTFVYENKNKEFKLSEYLINFENKSPSSLSLWIVYFIGKMRENKMCNVVESYSEIMDVEFTGKYKVFSENERMEFWFEGSKIRILMIP